MRIPKNQIHWMTYTTEQGLKYIVTSDINRLKYFLYKVENNESLTKLETSSKPLFKQLNH